MYTVPAFRLYHWTSVLLMSCPHYCSVKKQRDVGCRSGGGVEINLTLSFVAVVAVVDKFSSPSSINSSFSFSIFCGCCHVRSSLSKGQRTMVVGVAVVEAEGCVLTNWLRTTVPPLFLLQFATAAAMVVSCTSSIVAFEE